MYRYWLIALMFGLIGCGGGGSGSAMEVATNENNRTLKEENTTTHPDTFVPQESNSTLQDRISGYDSIDWGDGSDEDDYQNALV